MEKHLVKLSDEQLDRLISEFSEADPIDDERSFCLLLALNELQELREKQPSSSFTAFAILRRGRKFRDERVSDRKAGAANNGLSI